MISGSQVGPRVAWTDPFAVVHSPRSRGGHRAGWGTGRFVSRSSALAPLRARNFAWYYAATTVNLLGTTMAGIALTFGVLGLTGSTTSLGLVMAARTTPMVVLLLW